MAVETDERVHESDGSPADDSAGEAATPAATESGIGATLALAGVLGLAAAGLAAVLLRRGGSHGRGEQRTDEADEPPADDEADATGEHDEDAQPEPAAEGDGGERESADDPDHESEAEAARHDDVKRLDGHGGERDEPETAAAGNDDGEQLDGRRDRDHGDPEPGAHPAHEAEAPGARDRPSADSAAEAADGDRRHDAQADDDRADGPRPAAEEERPEGGAASALRRARERIAELTGREPESVSALERVEGGWNVRLELVEVARIPSTTDVLASYELQLDDDGEVLGYSRGRRYHRSQADEDAE